MADLEDQIFKQNVPGRYSSWWKNEDDSDQVPRHDSGDDESDKGSSTEEAISQSIEQEGSNSNSYSISSSLGGVKGVLNDFRQHTHQERNRCQKMEMEKKNNYSSLTQGASLAYGEKSCSLVSMKEQQQQQSLSSNLKNDDDDQWLSSSQDEHKYEFLKAHRAKRLDQWKEARSRNASHVFVFGEIAEVDPIHFAKIVDEEDDSNVTVIVHMYEECVLECVVLNSFLESLARSMPFARFLRLRAFAVDPAFDTVALPVIMVYKNGQLIRNHVRVCDEFESFTKNGVKNFLESCCGVLPPPSVHHCEEQQRIFSSDVSDDELDAFCSGFDQL